MNPKLQAGVEVALEKTARSVNKEASAGHWTDRLPKEAGFDQAQNKKKETEETLENSTDKEEVYKKEKVPSKQSSSKGAAGEPQERGLSAGQSLLLAALLTGTYAGAKGILHYKRTQDARTQRPFVERRAEELSKTWLPK